MIFWVILISVFLLLILTIVLVVEHDKKQLKKFVESTNISSLERDIKRYIKVDSPTHISFEKSDYFDVYKACSKYFKVYPATKENELPGYYKLKYDLKLLLNKDINFV